MNTRAIFVAALSAALLLASCGKNIDTADAVKAGVIKDLSKKMDVQNMDVNVTSVAFRGQEADASVAFSPKGAPPTQSITMKYTLTRDGDEWKIKTRSLDGVPGHAEAPGQMPAGHPTMGGNPGATPGDPNGALPPGHPTMGGQSMGGAAGGGTMVGPGGVPMPAGHPSVDPSKK